jgi:hypothetical protein
MSIQNEQTVEKQEEQKVVETENKSIVTVPVKRPIEIDEVLIDSIKLDFSNLTGADILKVDEELRLEGLSFNNIYNQRALLSLSSKASKMFPEDLQRLHGADYLEVVFATRNFFLTW